MTPLDYYKEKIAQQLITEDEEQRIVLEELQKLYLALIAKRQKQFSYFSWLRQPTLLQGLYIWGGVGIGKTFLMDCFYHCLPFQEKMRMHFHVFMKYIHQQLKVYQGEKNPLQLIAKELAKKTLVLCFDELVVTDIADAMILARLFDALFSQGVSLVCTSNMAPDELYKNGLQRKLFLPAIQLLKKHTQVMHVTTKVDYRLRHLFNSGVYYDASSEQAEQNMEKTFDIISNQIQSNSSPIEICNRLIPVKKAVGDAVWFDFDVICNIPRSQQDYLEIAEKYKTVFISRIPFIESHARDTISLFIRLVDVFYDARVKLIFSAVDQVENLYQSGPLKFEYARTCSRLQEMQSKDYFS